MRMMVDKIKILLCLLFLLPINVLAVEIDPSTGTFLVNSSTTFIIVARPPATADLLTLRLNVEGGTVTSLTIYDEYDSAGACTGGASFITDNVCVDISPKISGSSVPPFEDGEELGEFVITWSSSPTTGRIIKLDGDEGNLYINTANLNEYPDFGVAGNYNIQTSLGSSTPTPNVSLTLTPSPTPEPEDLPKTAIKLDDPVTQGFILIGLGWLLYFYISKHRNEKIQQ